MATPTLDPGIPYSELPFFIRDNGRQVNDNYDRGVATRRDTSRAPLSNKQLLAEGLYISRPLAHSLLLTSNYRSPLLITPLSNLNGNISTIIMETMVTFTSNGCC